MWKKTALWNDRTDYTVRKMCNMASVLSEEDVWVGRKSGGLYCTAVSDYTGQARDGQGERE